MEVRVVNNADEAYGFLKERTRYNYIYQFNNLSPKMWKNVVCYGLYDGSEMKEIAMLNINYHIPVLLAASFEGGDHNAELIGRLKKFLPSEFYTHMDRTTLDNIFSPNNVHDIEEYMNMGLHDYSMVEEKYNTDVLRIRFDSINQIKELISISYPEAWLDDDLVKLDRNFGIFVDGKLISFAGIHAYSEQYQVVAVAHVTTHPDYRKRGYGEKVVAALSNDLKNKIKYIGLNVKVDNIAAINCYKKLGYKEFGSFVGCEVINNI